MSREARQDKQRAKHLDVARRYLEPGELILAAVVGSYRIITQPSANHPAGTPISYKGVLVATDRRLVRVGDYHGRRETTVHRYGTVTGVTHMTGRSGCAVIVTTTGERIQFSTIDPQAPQLVMAIEERMDASALASAVRRFATETLPAAMDRAFPNA